MTVQNAELYTNLLVNEDKVCSAHGKGTNFQGELHKLFYYVISLYYCVMSKTDDPFHGYVYYKLNVVKDSPGESDVLAPPACECHPPLSVPITKPTLIE